MRAAELVAVQRLESAERRKLEERERRLRQVRAAHLAQASARGGKQTAEQGPCCCWWRTCLCATHTDLLGCPTLQPLTSGCVLCPHCTQERERKERERIVRAKVAASSFARGYLNGIVSNVFSTLQGTGTHGLPTPIPTFSLAPPCMYSCNQAAVLQGAECEQSLAKPITSQACDPLIITCAGFFVDPVQQQVEDAFLPWLKAETLSRLERAHVACTVAAQIVADAALLLTEQRAAAVAAADAEAAAAAATARQAVEAAAARAATEIASIRAHATYILTEMEPRLVDEDAVAAARADLQGQAQAEVEAAWELERGRVAAARRAELEAGASTAAFQVGARLVRERRAVAWGCLAAPRRVHLSTPSLPLSPMLARLMPRLRVRRAGTAQPPSTLRRSWLLRWMLFPSRSCERSLTATWSSCLLSGALWRAAHWFRRSQPRMGPLRPPALLGTMTAVFMRDERGGALHGHAFASPRMDAIR
jgi:hypothetical protein